MGIGTHLGIVSLAGASSFENTYSFAFDGTDDYIYCGANTNLRFNRLDPFTFSAWVKIDSTKTHTIFSNQDAPSTNYTGYFFAVNTSNQIIVILRANLSDRFIFTSTTTITTGTWNHIVFTYDGSATQSGGEIYINGSIDTITRVGSLVLGMTSTNPLYIGSRDSSDNFFDGNIDEVAIFNSELSASDVTTIYNSGVPNDLTSLSPVSWWRMGENATWTGREWNPIPDANGNNDGVGFNMAEDARSTDIPS